MATGPLRRGDIIRIRDERWAVWRHVLHSGASELEVRGCDRTNRGVGARFLLPFEQIEPVPVTPDTRIVTAAQWPHLARRLLSAAQPAWDGLRVLPAARLDILPFQLEPALAIVCGVACRVLIADEVGLGKTVQGGLIAAETLERTADAHVLIVTPAALREQWRAELRERFGLTPAVIDAASAGTLGARLLAGANPWAAERLVITSVDYVKRPEVLRALEGLVWDLVVIDEAHGAAGRSDRHAAATRLGERARALVLLSATPHGGDEEAFARLCGIGRLDERFPLLVFRRTREDAGHATARRTTCLKVAPAAPEHAMHRALSDYAERVWARRGESHAAARLAMIILAKRACSSAASLARSLERRLHWLASPPPGAGTQMPLPLEPERASDEEPYAVLAAPGLPSLADERHILEELLTRARRAEAIESKFRALRRLLRRVREPAIVFTEYRDTLVPLAAALADFRTAQLHGDVGTAERNDILRAFASGAVDVLLATDTASEGLNLHHRCRLVISLELPWTPSRLEQRVGRVDRIGQQRPVHQVHLVAAQTSEERVVAPLLGHRRQRVRQTLDALRPPLLQEGDVAACVLGGAPPPPSIQARRAGAHEALLVTDLRPHAIAEAERGRMMRALVSGSGSSVPAFRPFAAALAPRPARGLWAFRLEFTDPEDDLLWDTLIGVWYQLGARCQRHPNEIRRHIEAARATVIPAVQRHQRILLDALAATLQPAVATAIARETAIVAALERHHGRMAEAILQRGLFDRRAERDAASQSEALRDAMYRCSARLSTLERRQQVAAGTADAAFAALLR